MDHGIADEEPAADQEGNGKNQKRFGEDLLCRFPEMYHQREEQKNAAEQVRVGVVVRQRAESAACSKADAVFLAECAFHAADPEVDDQCDRENSKRIVVYIAGEEQELPYWYTAMLIVAFTLQLAGAILLMYILRNAQKAMAAAYRAYFLMSLIVFMPVCIADYKVSGSIIAYVLLVGDSIFIPVLLRSELHIYTLLMATATFVYCVFVSQGGIRVVIEAAVVGGLGIVAGLSLIHI